MSTSAPTPAKDGFPGPTELIATVLAAVAACVAAWRLFAPKFGRIRAIRDAVGYLDVEFRIFYQFPQYALVIVTLVIFAFLLLWFWESIHPGTISVYVPGAALRIGMAPQTLFVVVFSLSAFSAIIFWNLIPWVLTRGASLLALMPIGSLKNRYGSNGESIGWHQAVAVMEGPDKGQPLLLDNEAVDRAANEVLRRLYEDLWAPDYAVEPANLPQEEKANIALFGCIMEANYYAERWSPSPSWAELFASLADIQRSADPIFSPSELLSFRSGDAFFEAFRVRLRLALNARNQPSPPNDALAAASDITGAWNALNSRARGNTLQLIPPYARYIGGPIFWLDKRLRRFPKLRGDGMRPQLIKLLVRWHVLTADPSVFVQPFSKRQAWLLLQLGVLRALPDMNEVTFNSTGQVPSARIAALRVIRRVNTLLNNGASSEAAAVARKLGPSLWTRLETSDFVLWSWAHAEARQAAKDEWNKNKWHWKFEDGHVQRNA
jgi:hypothetical protein